MTNISVKIEVSFNVTDSSHIQLVTIPFEAKVRFMHDNHGFIYFAYEIGGKLFRPQLKDIRKFQKIYGVKSYVVVAEYMKGETLKLIHTY
jgi:hypothetical protein